jgi:hypothetical protein
MGVAQAPPPAASKAERLKPLARGFWLDDAWSLLGAAFAQAVSYSRRVSAVSEFLESDLAACVASAWVRADTTIDRGQTRVAFVIEVRRCGFIKLSVF